MSRARRGAMWSSCWGAIPLLAAQLAHADTTPAMGLAEGTPASVRCPNNAYLAGVAMQYNTTMSGLTPYCVGMAHDGAWAGGAQVYVDRAMSTGVRGGRRLDLFCPRDFYLTAFNGESQAYGIHALQRLTLTCRNLKTAALTLLTTGSGVNAVSTEWPGSQCPENEVAEAVAGRVWEGEIIQFALSCAITQPAAFSARLGQPDGALQAPWTAAGQRNVTRGLTKDASGAESAGSLGVQSALLKRAATMTAQSPAIQASPAFSAADPNACQAGYVWRLARPTDLVCVTQAARDRTAHENSADASLHDAKGAYGPNSCTAGYVWREAYRDDVVCVAPDTRTLVHQENAEAIQHRRVLPAGR